VEKVEIAANDPKYTNIFSKYQSDEYTLNDANLKICTKNILSIFCAYGKI